MAYWCDAHGSDLMYLGMFDKDIHAHLEEEHSDELGCKDDFIKFIEDHIVEE